MPLPFKTHLARLTENIGTPLRMKLHGLLRKRCFTECKREVYQNKPQVKILHMRLATAEEPSQPSLYMERAPLKKKKMVEEINQVIFEITNAH